MLHSRPKTILAHCISWLLFISLISGFVFAQPANNRFIGFLSSYEFILFVAVYLFVFYFNGYFLIPTFYLKKQYALYIAFIVLLFSFINVVRPFDNIMANRNRQDQVPPETDRKFHEEPPDENAFEGRPPHDNFDHPPPRGFRKNLAHGRPVIDIVSIILFIMVVAVSTAIQIVRQWRTTESRAVQAEADKATTELSFLRAQINPHFLFNTLNNIYSLVVTKNDKAPEAIMKLSGIMRYVTDEVTDDYVPLEWEVQCIEDYIDLQKIRLNEKAIVDFLVSGELEGKLIPPLILMTFIENVFKYGISNHEPTTITIQLSAEKQAIRFFCQNKIFKNTQEINRPGIGIENITKRLNQLYFGKHELNIDSASGLFTVELVLQS